MKVYVNDINIAYDEYGSGDNVWLLMHGNRDKRDYLEPIAKAIASHKGNHVFNIDLRGHGESDKPDYPYTLEMLIQDLELFLKMKEVNKLSIVGHSLGSTLALEFSKKHADRIKKLILISASAYFKPKFRPPDLKNFETVSMDDIHEKARRVLFSEDYPDIANKVISHWANTPESVHRCLLGVKHPDLRPELELIQAATLLITGEKDLSTTVEDAKYINQHMVNSYLVTIPKCSHFVYLEEPEKVSELIEKFI